MTTTPLRRTPPTDPDDITADILRTLRDAQSPVPVADLDAVTTDRRAVAAALARLARSGVVDIAAGHVTVSRAHRRAEQPDQPEPTPTPAPAPQTPKPTPTVRDVLGLITATLTQHGPMTADELTTHLPRATHPQIPAAITLGIATGVLGQRNNTVFAAAPTHRTRRRTAHRRGSA